MARFPSKLRVQLSSRGLATRYLSGKCVPARPEFRYIIIMRRPGGHGHVAVYEIVDGLVNVLNFYHTAQDWQGKLARGEW